MPNLVVAECDNFAHAVGYCMKELDEFGDGRFFPLQRGGGLHLCINCVNALLRGDGGRRMEYDARMRVRIVTRLPDA